MLIEEALQYQDFDMDDEDKADMIRKVSSMEMFDIMDEGEDD